MNSTVGEAEIEQIVARNIEAWGWGPLEEIEGLSEHKLAIDACRTGYIEALSTPAVAVGEDEVERVVSDRADWLLDAVAGATQDRRFLRGDPEYDAVAGDAILLNGEKAIRAAIDALPGEEGSDGRSPASRGRACAPSGLSRDTSQAEPLVPNATRFINRIADRFQEKYATALPRNLAIEMAVNTLEWVEREAPFGDTRFDWSDAGAVAVADEEISYWDAPNEAA